MKILNRLAALCFTVVVFINVFQKEYEEATVYALLLVASAIELHTLTKEKE